MVAGLGMVLLAIAALTFPAASEDGSFGSLALLMPAVTGSAIHRMLRKLCLKTI